MDEVITLFLLRERLRQDEVFKDEVLAWKCRFDAKRVTSSHETVSAATASDYKIRKWIEKGQLVFSYFGKEVSRPDAILNFNVVDDSLERYESDLELRCTDVVDLFRSEHFTVPTFLLGGLNIKPEKNQSASAAVIGPIRSDPSNAKPGDKYSGSVNWKMKIQIEAAARWKRLRSNGASPTKRSIKDDLASWCRENGVISGSGIYPSGDYIYRHVLQGWTPPSD